MWRVEATRQLDVRPAEIWRLYADPASWGRWGHSTRRATTDGPLTVGSIVTIEPTRGPRQQVRVVEFEPERRLATELSIPGARMRFDYHIEAGDQGCRVRHGVEMDGPLSWLYGSFMRRSNARKLTQETERLAREASGRT